MDEGVILWKFFLNLRDGKGWGFDVERDLTEKAWNQT